MSKVDVTKSHTTKNKSSVKQRTTKTPNTHFSIESGTRDQNPDELNEQSQTISDKDFPLDIDSIQAGTMSDEQLAIFARNYRFVCYVDEGLSIKEAMERVGMICTDSASRKLYKRYKERGVRGLMDARWLIKHVPRVLTPDITDRLLQWYFFRPAAGPKAIWSQVVKECEDRGVKSPGYEAVKKFLANLPKSYKQFRRGRLGIKEWSRQTRPVVRYELTRFSNQRWQVDHQQLRIWARVKVGDKWIASEVHISAYLDAHSRSIPGIIVSAKHPDSWTSSNLLMKAVLPKENPSWTNKGLPFVIQSDRGKDFMSNHVITMMARLAIQYSPDPPYYPNNKGKVERWFLTLDIGCLRMLPGHMDAIGTSVAAAERHIATLLTVPQIRQEIERWIVKEYHLRVHSETNRKPAELWEETVKLMMPASEEVFLLGLLKDDQKRMVRNIGVKFTPRGNGAIKNRYWSPELTHYGGCEIRIHYNPNDLECVHLHHADTNEFICEAWLMNSLTPRYTIEDVKRARNDYKRGLCERIKEYQAKIEREDRLNAPQIEWEEARRITESQQEAKGGPDDPQLDEVEALIELLERQASGEG